MCLSCAAFEISFKGTFGIEAVKDYVNSFMDLLYSASEEIIASMNTGVEEAVSTETIKQAIQTMYLLSVSFIAVLCFSCGYFSTVFFKMSLRSAGVLEKVFPCGYKLKISFVSAVVYILICTFHLFLTFGNDAEMYFVFYNLKIIITHIFLAYGFERAMEFLEELENVNVFKTYIRIDSAVEWAQDNSQPVAAYKKNSRSAKEYAEMAKEMLEYVNR